MVERDGLVPPCRSGRERMWRLRQVEWSIAYIAAILGRHADVYEELAGFTIRHDAAVLCTLYQGGDSEMRAHRLAARLRQDNEAVPIPGNSMGPWVGEHLDYVRSVLGVEAALGLADAGSQ